VIDGKQLDCDSRFKIYKATAKQIA